MNTPPFVHTRAHAFWRAAVLCAGAACYFSFALVLYASLAPVSTAGQEWALQLLAVCALLLFACAIGVRPFERGFCRTGIYSVLALPLVLALWAYFAGSMMSVS